MGTYTVYNTLAASGGCASVRDSATISIEAAPTATVTASGATSFCPGDSVTLTATGGGTYLWSNGATSASITVRTGGTYYVAVTNAAGCADTSANTTVTVLPAPAQPTLTPVMQPSGIVLLTVTPVVPGAQYQYYYNNQPLPITTDSVLAVTLGTQSGAYSVTVTGANGCASVPSATVNVTVTGMAALQPAASLDVFPNPTSGLVRVALANYREAVTLTVFDALGRTVQTVTVPAGTTTQELNLTAVPTGVYLLRARTAHNVTTHRIVRD